MAKKNKQTTSKSTGLRINLALYWTTKHWIRIAIVLLGIYISLPYAAPIMMRVGATGVADVIYTLYSPMCHQFAFRSTYLFGEQVEYPREVAGSDLGSFESYAVQSDEFTEIFSEQYQAYNGVAPRLPLSTDDLQEFTPWLQFSARQFPGDETFGYKATLCQRDLAIYTAMLAFLVLYSFFRFRIRPLPILIFIIAGAAPVGIDGFSQLLSYPPFDLWEVRETLPIFRYLTGALFGFHVAWLGFPHVDLAMRDVRIQLKRKFDKAGVEVD